MSRDRARCILEHPHPGRGCRDPRGVYRNRWGGAPTTPPVEVVDGQLDLLATIEAAIEKVATAPVRGSGPTCRSCVEVDADLDVWQCSSAPGCAIDRALAEDTPPATPRRGVA